MEATSHVHIGRWTNWGEGSIQGARITLSDSGGAYLIAFLALFVRLAGQHSWGILCYLTFKYRQHKTLPGNDPFRAASQSILRNTNIDSSAAWQFLSFSWEHKSVVKGRVGRSIAWSIFAATHAIAFIAAGIFVSKVAESGSTEVLLRGPVCGVWQDPDAYDLYSSGNQSDVLENNQWGSWVTQQILAASEFSRQCYNVSSSTSALANCNAYAPRLLEWNATTNTSCPWDPKMCRNDLVVRFDSGPLDSLYHFGVNSKAQDRVKYRRVVECSPLVRDNYVSDILTYSEVEWPYDFGNAGAAPQQNGLFQEYRYGPNVDFNMTSTYIWSNGTLGPPNFGNIAPTIFSVDTEISMPDCEDCSTFTPISELNRTDADLIMYFLLSVADYIEEVNDPWFQATTVEVTSSFIFTNENSDSFNDYTSDYNASVLACAQQFQYCNHDGSRCSELRGEAFGGSLPDSIDSFSDSLNLNSRQLSTLSRLAQASWNADMYYPTFSNGGGNLLAELSSASTWSLPGLPDNQWILEMQHYFLLGMTSMQMQMAAYAVGPPDSSSYNYITPPTEDERWMCDSQIVQRTGYSTFSVLGIAIVVVIGGLMILINLSIPAMTHRAGYYSEQGLQEGSAWNAYHHISRTLRDHGTDSVYQLTNTGEKSLRSLDPATMETIIDSPESAKQATIYQNDFSRNIYETSATEGGKYRPWDFMRHKARNAQQETLIG